VQEGRTVWTELEKLTDKEVQAEVRAALEASEAAQ
jgi:hypothetical protein